MHGLFRRALVLAGALTLMSGTAAGVAAAKTTPPMLVFNPAPVNFNAVTVGQTASQVVTVKNTGGTATSALKLTLAVTGGAPGAFSLTANTCTGTSLGPGKTCTITVQFAPTAAGESDTATVTVVSNKPDATAVLGLSGQGAGTASLAWVAGIGSPDFGSIPVGNVGVQEFALQNSGTASSAPLTVSVTNINGTAFTIDSGSSGGDQCTGKSLAPGGVCDVAVDYSPTQNGEHDAATLSAGGATLSLSGAAAPQDLTLSPGTSTGTFPDGSQGYFYGSLTSGVAQTFTVTNNDASSYTQPLSLITAGGDPSYTITNDRCDGVSLSPGGDNGSTCTFDVTWTQPAGCTSGPPYMENVPVTNDTGTSITYISLTLSQICP